MIRTRIAPAPSGDLHVGNVRTALYSWALARRHGGSFLLRIEDTDASRVSEPAVAAVSDILRWVGLDFDEGPDVGGPFGPYRQSERGPHYRAATGALQERGAAYRCFCTPEAVAARRAASGGRPGYDGHCRAVSGPDSDARAAAGEPFILRFAMPPGATTWTDLVRGDITINHSEIPDFALTRSDGGPLYVLAAAVDDLAMRLTHVVRGEDLIAATPRQMALYAALGAAPDTWPAFAHLPLIVGADHKPLSKRNGEVSLRWYREHGYLPEALRNYLALLGWSLAADREIFDTAEMVAAFDLERVSRNPARFDIAKLDALNGEWIRRLSPPDLADRVQAALSAQGLTVDVGVLARAVPLIATRMVRLTEAPDLLGFLFVDEDAFVVTDHAMLVAEVLPTLDAAHAALSDMVVFDAQAIEEALRAALVDGLGLKPKQAFGPVRVAVTGRRISPPLFESLELLGQPRTLARLDAARVDIRGY